jgi:HK97 gp10 family phage protein
MSARVTVTLVGAAELRRKLLAMSEAVSGPILEGIVRDEAEEVLEIAKANAPVRTGALRRGLAIDLQKEGRGYCYFVLNIDPKTYYALFQEYGLGNKRGRDVSARTLRRRANYETTARLAKRGFTSTSAGLNKGQARRLRKLERGGNLQGQRRPNMKAHPFIRPATRWRATIIRRRITERLAGEILDAAQAGP